MNSKTWGGARVRGQTCLSTASPASQPTGVRVGVFTGEKGDEKVSDWQSAPPGELALGL